MLYLIEHCCITFAAFNIECKKIVKQKFLCKGLFSNSER